MHQRQRNKGSNTKLFTNCEKPIVFKRNSRLFLLQKIKRRKEKCDLRMSNTKADL